MTRFLAATRTLGRYGLAATLLLVGAAHLEAQDKAAVYSQMESLAAQIQQLKPSSDDAAVRLQLEGLVAQYRALSGQLGGDDPFQLGNSPAPQRTGKAAKAAPTAPTGSTATTANFANNTPVSIVDNTAVTSDIVVSGAGTYLFDLDLNTDITHTFGGDLDITLTSPAGTVVTITTDNGGGNDDVFSGTLFDDQAADAATDFTYADGVPATPLQPEGSLQAFVGEDPNGTWTIEIFDDAGGDTGTLNSWSLDVTTLDVVPELTAESLNNSTPVSIVDNTAVTSDIVVAVDGTYICDVDLTTDITHTFGGDLDITITSPAGTVTTVTTDNGGGNDDVFSGTLFDDGAGDTVTDFTYADGVPATPLVPEGSFGAFVGEDPNGTWTLEIFDDAGGDTGTLNSWDLTINTCTAGAALPIPTIGEWGLLALLLALGTAGVLFIRRR